MLYNECIWFLDQINIGLDPQIMILPEVISEILEISATTHGGSGGGGWDVCVCVHGDPR